MSTEKFSLLGTGKALTVVAVVVVVAERGESPVDEGDILARGPARLVAKVRRENGKVVTREELGPEAPPKKRSAGAESFWTASVYPGLSCCWRSWFDSGCND